MSECKCGDREAINRYGHLSDCKFGKPESKEYWIHLTTHGWIVHFEPITSISKVIHVREVVPIPSENEINHMANNSCRDLFEVSETKFITGYHEGFKKALELMGYRK